MIIVGYIRPTSGFRTIMGTLWEEAGRKLHVQGAQNGSPNGSPNTQNVVQNECWEQCTKMTPKVDVFRPPDTSSEGFPPARESYFHFYSSAQKMIQKGLQNELFWTTLAPAGLQNAGRFSTQNLRTFSKQMSTPPPPTLRDGRNAPSLGVQI